MLLNRENNTMMEIGISDDDDDAKYFCYLIIKQNVEAWIGLGFAILATVLALIGSFQLHKAKSMGMLNLSVKLIYVSIFLWATRTNNEQ